MSVIPILVLLFLQAVAQAPAAKPPEQNAVDYLSAEAVRWPAENQCFSCHNNGDGARTLILAYKMKYPGVEKPLESTLAWLQKPEEWGKSGQTGFGDQKLARIQFAAALADAVDAGLIKERSRLALAADLLATHQEANGSWQVDAEGSAPSAVSYGSALATFMARRTLERADPARFKDAIARADTWLGAVDMTRNVNAAVVALALEGRSDTAAKTRFDRALDVLLKAQNGDGGWGSYAKTPAAPFETAMALLALNTVRGRGDIELRILKGRAFLASVQYEDGGWPAGPQSGAGETYARHISTSAWAAQALLATKR